MTDSMTDFVPMIITFCTEHYQLELLREAMVTLKINSATKKSFINERFLPFIQFYCPQ